ncbi:rutC family protein HP_0944-like isoform X1 [Dermacentor albipictus]|uniref:rutC family protein HP_0944-like isoform X1 n=1 Tax=Dermacentor albipictus TaxID=60249 RepID=UPI0038FCBEFC
MLATFVSRQLRPTALVRNMSKVTREVITSEHAPKALGPYSQAIRAGDTMYVSGQLGVDPSTGKLVSGGISAETRQALVNLTKVLEAGRMSLKCVAKCTVYLGNMNDFQEMNKVYSEFFTEKQPARAAFQVAKLPLEASVEIEAVAVDVEPSGPRRSLAKL